MPQIEDELESALASIFVPLARLLLKNQIEAKPVVELLRSAFIQVAHQEFGNRNRKASVTRVSRLTGYSRKTVKQLASAKTNCLEYKDVYARSEESVLNTWMTDPKYLTKNGRPRRLRYGPGTGTFCNAVEESLGTESPSDIRDALVRRGRITENKAGSLDIVTRELEVSEDLVTLLSGVGTLVDTIGKNWGRTPDTCLTCLQSFSTCVNPTKTEVVRRVLEKKVADFAMEADAIAAGYEGRSEEPFRSRDRKELNRLGVTAYYFEIEK